MHTIQPGIETQKLLSLLRYRETMAKNAGNKPSARHRATSALFSWPWPAIVWTGPLTFRHQIPVLFHVPESLSKLSDALGSSPWAPLLLARCCLDWTPDPRPVPVGTAARAVSLLLAPPRRAEETGAAPPSHSQTDRPAAVAQCPGLWSEVRWDHFCGHLQVWDCTWEPQYS